MRVSLLGTSHWHAAMHLDAMRFAGADIVAVWDADPHRAAGFAETAAAPAAGFDAAVAAADLVVLMGHPAQLPAQARAVIEARKPLILEKPAVTATAELEHLCALAAATDAFVGVRATTALLTLTDDSGALFVVEPAAPQPSPAPGSAGVAPGPLLDQSLEPDWMHHAVVREWRAFHTAIEDKAEIAVSGGYASHIVEIMQAAHRTNALRREIEMGR